VPGTRTLPISNGLNHNHWPAIAPLCNAQTSPGTLIRAPLSTATAPGATSTARRPLPHRPLRRRRL